MKIKFLQFLLAILISGNLMMGCSSKETKQEPEIQKNTEAPKVVTANDIEKEYIQLICRKYKECGVDAFKDDEDCQSRVAASLNLDPRWKKLELKEEKLKLCLTDFEKTSCEDFKQGLSPESCQIL